jgi:hypothetical protein
MCLLVWTVYHTDGLENRNRTGDDLSSLDYEASTGCNIALYFISIRDMVIVFGDGKQPYRHSF